MPRKTSSPQRFYCRVREAEESFEEISAAGAENTQSFSAVEFHKLNWQQFQVLISLDYPSRRQEARLLLYPCAGIEIAPPPSCRRRLNLDANEAFAAAMVPNAS
jgi:hypothetical protein